MLVKKAYIIGVIGGRKADIKELVIAEKVGRLLAENSVMLICGGLGGVMEASARGAKTAGGVTVGILPQEEKEYANDFIDIPIATGLGIGRNIIIARTADALIAVGGEYGTLSEIAFGLQMNKPVIGIGSWRIDGVIDADNPDSAVKKALSALSAD